MTDFIPESNVDLHFTSRKFSTGAPFTLAGSPVIAAYEDNSTTEITAGITLTVDFDGRTGLNHVRVVATAANSYESGKHYSLVLTAGTVDGVSVAGEVIGEFTLGLSAPWFRIGHQGTELQQIPWNASWDAEVQSEAADALVAYDPPTEAEMNTRTIAAATYATAATLAAVKAVTDLLPNAGALTSLVPPTATQNADALLDRDMAAGADTVARSPRNALRAIRNKVSRAGTTITVTKEDDTATAWTATITTDAAAVPITEVDP